MRLYFGLDYLQGFGGRGQFLQACEIPLNVQMLLEMVWWSMFGHISLVMNCIVVKKSECDFGSVGTSESFNEFRPCKASWG